MPFTFSHPAFVLPFLKIRQTWVCMSGLVIGSVTPDFEYFIKMKLAGRYGHSIEGIFLLDLPIACVLAIIFHGLVKKPVINNLPDYFYKRLVALRDFNFFAHVRTHFVSFICCLLIGISSHILWDSFTHANGLEKSISFLSTRVSMAGVEIPLFRILQHASTAIGAGFIILAFHRQPGHEQESVPSLKFWIIGLVIACAVYAIRAAYGFDYLGDIVTAMISAGIIGVIASSLFARAGWISG